jgi:microcin C transport system permease protein
MFAYFIRRLIAIIPTLFGITLICFLIINLAPGGPIEQKLQQMRFGGGASAGSGSSISSGSSGNRGNSAVTEKVIEELKKQYGFDKPVHVRYWIWLKNLVRLDFGRSFSYEEPAIDVIVRKLPVSIQFGLISYILTYLVCIPLGIKKAVKHGSAFDRSTSVMIFIAYSVPAFMLAILLIVLFGGGSFFNWFPIAGIISDDYDSLSFFGKILDRVHHFILPMICYMIGHFTVLTMLMKNSVLEETKKDYVRTARSKGLPESIVIHKHVVRNALIPIATGMGSIFTAFFAGSILIERIFSLDGMGLLSFQSILSRDYNVVMGLLVLQSLFALIGNIFSDFLYILIDPRIDFSSAGK